MPVDLVTTVFREITRQQLLCPGDSVGVGVSGGADSVALLRLLHAMRGELGICLTVVHFNHQLRGAESDADEEFVAALATALGLPFRADREDVAASAREHGWNLEDAGRQLRYGYFASLVDAGALTRIAVAHTANDQAETVMARLVRGTGPAGLAAIYPVHGAVVRPLLQVRRAELRGYLENLGQTWREDSSNFDRQRLRARLRHDFLPQMERELQPAIVANLGRLAQMAREDESFWKGLVAERLTALVSTDVGDSKVAAGHGNQVAPLAIRCADLLAPIPWDVSQSADARFAVTRRLVRGLLERLRGDCRELTSQHVEQVLRLAMYGSSGQSTELPGAIVERSFEWLRFYAAPRSRALGAETESGASTAPASTYFRALELSAQGSVTEVVIPEIGRRFRLKVIDWPSLQRETNLESCVLDRDLLHAPLVLRSWQPGDSIRPKGRRSVHKLKHFLRAGRIGVSERAGWPVLTSAGELAWARGLPVAAEFAPRERTQTGVLIDEEEI